MSTIVKAATVQISPEFGASMRTGLLPAASVTPTAEAPKAFAQAIIDVARRSIAADTRRERKHSGEAS